MNLVPTTFVTSCIREFQETNESPNFLWSVFNNIHKVHKLCRLYKRGKLYSSPDNYVNLALANTVGRLPLVDLAAHTVVISSRIMKCIHQKQRIHSTWKKLVFVSTSKYILPKKQSWKKEKKNWRNSDFYNRISLIARKILKGLYRLSVLSGQLLDAIEGFSINSQNKRSRIDEAFCEGIDSLLENKSLLIEGLEENKKIINKMLCSINSTYEAEKLIEDMSQLLEKTDEVNKKFKKVAKKCKEKAGEVVKRALYRSAARTSIDLANLLPDSWVPSTAPLTFGEPEVKVIQCLPDHLAIRPSKQVNHQVIAKDTSDLFTNFLSLNKI